MRPELEERVARAMYERPRTAFPQPDAVKPYKPWGELPNGTRSSWMRAAQAAIPIIVEECAKTIEEMNASSARTGPLSDEFADRITALFAASIRTLAKGREI